MKGLNIILEQKYNSVTSAESDGWSLERPNNYSSTTHDIITVNGFQMYKAKEVDPSTPDPSTPDPVKPDPVKPDPVPSKSEEEVLRNKLLVMFDSFKIFDQNGTELVKSVKNDEANKNSIVDSSIRKGKGKSDKVLDDIFIQTLVRFLIDKNKLPMRIEYPEDYEINLFESVVKGLSKVLFEQSYAGLKTIWIKYKEDGKNFGFTTDKNAAVYSVNSLPSQSQPVSGPDKNPAKSPVEKEVKKTPEKRPEEELGVKNSKLLNDIYKMASIDGVDTAKDLIEKHFSSRQKRIIKSLNNEGYAVLRPINPDMYQEIDVKEKYTEDFEPFKEFKMYKILKDGIDVENRASSIKELSNLQKITKGQCKEIIEQYYEMGITGDFEIEDEERRSAARQVYRCRRQHKFGGMFDFSGIDDKLREIGGMTWAQDPDSGLFAINYNNKTVGTDDNVISLK